MRDLVYSFVITFINQKMPQSGFTLDKLCIGIQTVRLNFAFVSTYSNRQLEIKLVLAQA